MGVILAGVRVATVIGVGTATISAAIGAGGLGNLIFAGIAIVVGALAQRALRAYGRKASTSVSFLFEMTIREAIAQLAGKISATEMQEMNYQVDGEFRKLEEVVAEFLESKGLI